MNIYHCPYCKKSFTNPQDAFACFRSHDVVYLMINRTDLQTLIRFIYTGDMSLLTESLVNTILSYAKYNPKEE